MQILSFIINTATVIADIYLLYILRKYSKE